MTNLSTRLAEARQAIEKKAGGRKPAIAIVLGSGLGAFADALADAVTIPYGEIPHFRASNVSGHAGALVLGTLHGVPCAVMKGRVHFYEGYSAAEVAFPIRTLVSMGAKTVIVTNAAGGINVPAGSLMLISDHIHMIPDSPLRGDNDDKVGPRFPDMTRAYHPGLRHIAREAARRLQIPLEEGVYMSSPGPAYETPAEIVVARNIGADAVGMSTTPEVIAAVHMGAKVLGVSCISNAAAGLGNETLTHEEVKETAARVAPRFKALLEAIVADLQKETL